MGHVEDRWHVVRDGRKIRTARYGTGKRWRARYEVAGRERSASFDRRLDADRHLAAAEVDQLRGAFVDPRLGRRPFREYALQWLEVQPLRDSSRRSYAAYLRVRVLPALGDKTLAGVRRTDVLALRRRLEQDLSAHTVRAVMRLVSGIFAGAVEDGLLVASPAVRVTPRRPERRKVVPLTVEQVEAIAAAAPDRYRAAVVLAAGCGLRLGEVFGLTAGRVRFLERELDVDGQVGNLTLVPGAGPPRLGPTKTRSSARTVPVPDVVAGELARHLALFPAGPGELVFRSRTGGLVWPNTFNGSVWRPMIERARRGIELPGQVRFHDLRHFCASLLIDAGESPVAVAALLGHADETETLRTYSHLWPDAPVRARAAVDAAFASGGRGDRAAAPRRPGRSG